MIGGLSRIHRYSRRRPTTAAGFVSVSGQQLMLNGQQWIQHGATVYGWGMNNRSALISLAQSAGLNCIEPVNFESNFNDVSTSMTEATWVPIDDLLARCRTAGLKLLLNLSGYGHSLAANGQKPTNVDWNTYLSFVMNRVNTINGITYKNDNTIAKIELYGEVAAPNYSEPMRGTTAETTAFFSRTLGQLRALTSNHVISTGGFSYLDSDSSGIDWQTIMSGVNNQICDIEINSMPDRNIAVPNVAAYAVSIGKPWFLAAFSSCQGVAGFGGDANHWANDSLMADHFEDCYRIARAANATAPAPSNAACGAHFWNLGQTPAQDQNCDISPNYPLTFAKVQQWAPVPPSGGSGGVGATPLGTGQLGN
jgi:hypothetical protein